MFSFSSQAWNARILRLCGVEVYDPTREKIRHSAEYRIVLETLVGLRRKAGLSQRALAQRLGREYSFVWRIETGERRLDLVEFAWVCHAWSANPSRVYAEMAARWRKPERVSLQ